ncbi:maleylacetoacetate isomerase [Aurantivibrio infirmus]
MKLYSFYRSSAAYRVRIALNLKALDFETIPVSLKADRSEQHSAPYKELNPQGFVPTLVDDGESYTQSNAIIEYLEERYPDIPLLPETVAGRARVRAMAQLITADIHPLNNLRVLNYLRDELKQNQDNVDNWYRYWISKGFLALEDLVTNYGGDYSYGNTITLADVCLIPQIANANRLNTDLSAYPNLVRINEALLQHPAFLAAAPEAQPDAE